MDALRGESLVVGLAVAISNCGGAEVASGTDASVDRHIGPMAQDFHAAFGLGDTDRAYDPIDAHGVAFAAIQALSERVAEQSARLGRLERENQELRPRACGR